MEFIKKDIHNWEKKARQPQNQQNWYRFYKKLYAESQLEMKADAEKLKAAMQGIQKEREKCKSKHVAPSEVPPLPKMGGMKYVRNPRKSKKFAEPPTKLTFQAGSRTKVMTGKGVINKARREAKEQSLFGIRSQLAVPTHKLNQSASQVIAAPRALVRDYLNPVAPPPIDPTVKPAEVFTLPKKRPLDRFESSAPAQPKAIKAIPTPTLVSSKTLATAPRPQSTSDMPLPAPAAASKPHRPIHLNINRPPMIKRRADVDPFMPAKRRRLS